MRAAIRSALLGLLLVATASASVADAPALSERRVALVLGNATYSTTPIPAARDDARAMAAALRRLGFDVTERLDLGQVEMQRAIVAFGRALTSGTVALFYYTGRAMQINGHHYLLPVDATVASAADVETDGIQVDFVLEQVKANDANIVILDTCRDNPLGRAWSRRSTGSHTPPLEVPAGTVIAYATLPGAISQEGVYTTELLRVIEVPGLRIEEVFKRVRGAVAQRTNNKQIPWETSSLTKDFFFVPPR